MLITSTMIFKTELTKRMLLTSMTPVKAANQAHGLHQHNFHETELTAHMVLTSMLLVKASRLSIKSGINTNSFVSVIKVLGLAP